MSESERTVRHNIETRAKEQQSRSTSAKETQSNSRHLSPAKKDSPKQNFEMQRRASEPPQRNENELRIRISTTEGKQITVDLLKCTTYSALQQHVYTQLHIPVHQQRIKFGFPPKILLAPAVGHENDPVPLQHGDKVIVEVIHDRTYSVPDISLGVFNTQKSHHRASIDIATGVLDSHFRDTMEQIASAAEGDLDSRLTSLTFLVGLGSGHDLWTTVKAMPHLFSVGGLLYDQVKRDLGLEDRKHVKLQILPDRVFCYNQRYDRLELCVEPHGHFAISPAVESEIEEARQVEGSASGSGFDPSASSSSGGQFNVGQSGAVRSRDPISSHFKAFSGPGHTLTSETHTGQSCSPTIQRRLTDDRMPEDIYIPPHHLMMAEDATEGNKRLLIRRSTVDDSIPEEGSPMETSLDFTGPSRKSTNPHDADKSCDEGVELIGLSSPSCSSLASSCGMGRVSMATDTARNNETETDEDLKWASPDNGGGPPHFERNIHMPQDLYIPPHHPVDHPGGVMSEEQGSEGGRPTPQGGTLPQLNPDSDDPDCSQKYYHVTEQVHIENTIIEEEGDEDTSVGGQGGGGGRKLGPGFTVLQPPSSSSVSNITPEQRMVLDSLEKGHRLPSDDDGSGP